MQENADLMDEVRAISTTFRTKLRTVTKKAKIDGSAEAPMQNLLNKYLDEDSD